MANYSWTVYKLFMNCLQKRTFSSAFANTFHEQFINCSWTVRQSIPFLGFGKHCSRSIYKFFMNNSSKRIFFSVLANNVHEQFLNCSWTVCRNQSVTKFGKHCSWTLVLQTICQGVHEQTGKQITLNISPVVLLIKATIFNICLFA